jgi:hypothetical protein
MEPHGPALEFITKCKFKNPDIGLERKYRHVEHKLKFPTNPVRET